jgi:hypothetical protein
MKLVRIQFEPFLTACGIWNGLDTKGRLALERAIRYLWWPALECLPYAVLAVCEQNVRDRFPMYDKLGKLRVRIDGVGCRGPLSLGPTGPA